MQKKKKKTRVCRFNQPFYKSVEQSFIESLAIRLVTKTGKNVVFEDSDILCLVIWALGVATRVGGKSAWWKTGGSHYKMAISRLGSRAPKTQDSCGRGWVYIPRHQSPDVIQGGSNMTGTDLCVNKPHCAAAVRPWESEATTSTLPPARVRTCSVLSGSC